MTSPNKALRNVGTHTLAHAAYVYLWAHAYVYDGTFVSAHVCVYRLGTFA